MKFYAGGLARQLHQERIAHQAGRPAPPEVPNPPEGLQKFTNRYNGGEENCEAGPSDAAPTGIVTKLPRELRIAQQVKSLTQAQQCGIDLLILGHTDRSVANQLNVHRVTVTGWRLYHPRFRAELSRRRQEVWNCAAEKFRGMLTKAIEILARHLDEKDADVNFRAARAILELARKFQPADEAQDVEGVLSSEARRRNVEYYELHPSKALVYEEDRAEALKELGAKAAEDFTISVERANESDEC